ncbi:MULTISPECIES: hypothetical protein [unclassified Nocardia]|uniref:hypothetical protein n=1 Tax=unclassified Nocardia TaxID=2637762 RepID=UPI001CE49CE7|nr:MULTISPECIES: hypothetical protein [unclassified Nocardia]
MIRRTSPDIRFARTVLDTIRALPNHTRHPGAVWDQWVYREVDIHGLVYADNGATLCRTAMCFAGWTVELDPDVGWVYDTMSLRIAGLVNTSGRQQIRVNPDLTTALDLATGQHLIARDYAQRRLGLTSRQATELFAATNTVDDLAEIIDRIGKGLL